MAVRHQLVRTPPDVVWSVLADPTAYGRWVVGTAETEPCDGHWPEVGASLSFDVRLGPLTLSNRTVVRYSDPPRELGLEAHSGPLGTARIALTVQPWGDDTLVVADEHPLRGAGGSLHNPLFEVLVQLRHRTMLGRLAKLCEDRHRRAGRAPAPAAPR
ncbi:SRPBCC family protein [Streptomyces sp. NPDC059785]|uniref:SRPBCC family protein n=1 Tax=unclassified Streptomyces TaxID=2593676 RepID=UPI003662EDC3